MNKIKIFENAEFGKIRTVQMNNETYFVGKDIATALGYAKPTDAVRKHVDEDDRGISKMETPSGIQEMSVINESGLYALIIGSKLESAKRFKHWVTSEVLPSIRKHGGYIAGQETMTDDELMAKALLVAQNKIAERDAIIHRQQMQIEADKPKTIFADAVSSSDSSILIRDLAKLLRQNGVKTGEKRLYQWMRENGYIIKNSLRPTQKAMELGLFEISERTVTRGDRLPIVTQTTRVTGKGQMYFINKFLTA